MKTKTILIIAVFLMIASVSQAFSPTETLYFLDAKGQILTLPCKMEKAIEEDIPFDQEAVLREARTEQSGRVFDISRMSKPEPDADDIPESLKHLILR